MLDPSPIVRINRVVAVAEIGDPDVSLTEVDRLAETLDGYHTFHTARAGLLRRVEAVATWRAAYDRAIELAGNSAEQAHLRRRRDHLTG